MGHFSVSGLAEEGFRNKRQGFGFERKCFRLGNEAFRVKKRGLGLSNVGKAALGGYRGIRKQVANPYNHRMTPGVPTVLTYLRSPPKP